MSFLLQAPLPGLQTTTVLPDPDMNDSASQRQTVTVKHSMTGFKRSFVKSNVRKRLHFGFTLSRMKSLELRAFITAYYRARLQITTHAGEVWQVNFVSNPFEFLAHERAGGWPGSEVVQITLEFEGTKTHSVTPDQC